MRQRRRGRREGKKPSSGRKVHFHAITVASLIVSSSPSAREEEQTKVREEEEKNWRQAMSGELSGPRRYNHSCSLVRIVALCCAVQGCSWCC